MLRKGLLLLCLALPAPAAAAGPGDPDPTFGGNGTVITPVAPPNDWSTYDEVRDVLIQPDGKVVATGNYYIEDDEWDSWNEPMAIRYNRDGTLDVGLPVKVVAAIGAPVTGIILPRAALTQAPNGQTVVFAQKEPEVFEPKAVRVEPFDAGRVRILAGVEAGETIVVEHAPLVAQIR